jgi:SAM-dependent methyltransferase
MPEESISATFEFRALAQAANYRQALLAEFAGCLHGRVLEVGAGVGQVTRLLRQNSDIRVLVAVEPERRFCEELRRALPDQLLVQGTVAAISPATAWDVVLSVNVLEHIPADEDELRRYHELLAPRQGALCLFVPAGPGIYLPIDRRFGHFRRYTRTQLRRKLQSAGFTVARIQYFNLVGYFAWWIMFGLLKKETFAPAAVRFFDRWILPPQHWWESRVCRPPLGQSLVAIAVAG